MAIWNEKFYKGKDVYSDGSIEDEILEIVCRNDYKERKNELIGDNFVLAYHLSAIRENILNWYPFSKEESAIEIGAGCGAITGMLCRKLGKVVSVDLSKRRSKINYERHKEYDNLEIIIGNFNDMELEEQYDYVVLNGVFEYAISFTDSEKPYHDFLRHISRFLKPNGKFLISIENKLGLKYFNGAKEDHTGNYFLGLNEYQGNETVRTFSKTELEEILGDEGYTYTKFYYPYPDYKFPNEIFTEESMESNQYGRPYINIETDRYWLFDENAVGKTLIKENVRNIFANSFLVEASKEAFDSEVIYAKMNVERAPQFQIGTSIVKEGEKKHVCKYAIHPMAEEHISQICQTTKFDGEKVSYLPAQKMENGICFEFICEQNQDAVICELMKNKEVEEICDIINLFFSAYLEEFAERETTASFYSDTFKQYFGKENSQKEFLCIKNANIDVIMDNVYEINGKYVLIDGEWIYPEWIPYAFIKWRAINELYSKHIELEGMIPRSEMMQKNNISAEDESMFFAWAIHFAEVYVGSSLRRQWAKAVKHISMDEIHQEIRAQRLVNMSLYIDYGEGFTEEGKLYQDVDIEDGTFSVTFIAEQLKDAKRLRFDPIEGHICVAKVDKLSKGLELIEDNSRETSEEGNLFINFDPQFYIKVLSECDSVFIKGSLVLIKEDEIIKWMQKIDEGHAHEVDICKNTIVAQKGELKQKDEAIAKLMEEKNALAEEKNTLAEEKNALAEENERNAYYANNTKAFLKRKIMLKLGKIKE